MSNTSKDSRGDDNFRLEEIIKDLRNEIEVLHNQQSYLQTQITSLLKGVELREIAKSSFLKSVRNLLVTNIKRSKRLYRIAFNIRRALKR